MLSPKKLFSLIVLLTAISLYFALPTTMHVNLSNTPLKFERTFTKRPIAFQFFSTSVNYNPEIKLGLDLQGGVSLLLQADMSSLEKADRINALESAQDILRRRVDSFGVAEPLIQTSVNEELEQYRIIVELPGVDNVDQAVALVGKTAQLEFREENPDFNLAEASESAVTLDDIYLPTGLTGDQLERATVEFDPQTSEPVVTLTFNNEGAAQFKEITERNVGKRIAIVVDGEIPTAPVVNVPITDGVAVIQGDFTTETAKSLAIQLNAGALPVPIEIISQKTVGATLGRESVQESLFAGFVGLVLVMAFMIMYYGYLGLLADIALIVYALTTLSLYKILGITLTLPGISGFILSVGMAVDSNILIFERYKEEIRSGKDWAHAMELGFGRAWDSIKDANVATLTICFILFNPFDWQFLNSSGIVRGFALNLALGILISMFTGLVVTRTLIRMFYDGSKVKTQKD